MRNALKIAVVVLALLLWFAPRPWQPKSAHLAFRKTICSPIPRSVKSVEFSCGTLFDHDGSVSTREHFAFSVSSNDLGRIVSTKAFQRVERDVVNRFVDTNAPPWFQIGSIGSNGQFFLFSRVKRTDCLWVDEAGTNCFYLFQRAN